MHPTQGIRAALPPLILLAFIGWSLSAAAPAAPGPASPVPAPFAFVPLGPLLREAPRRHPTHRRAAASPAASPSAAAIERTAGVPVGTTEALEELVRRASSPFLEPEGPLTGLPSGFSRSLCILGSTGSIGTQALQVVREFPHAFNVRVLAATGERLKPLVEQALEFTPELIVVGDSQRAADLQELLREAFEGRRGSSGKRSSSRKVSASNSRKGQEEAKQPVPTVLHGAEALEHAATLPGIHCVLLAISGFKGLRPALAALKAGKDVALATKEALVAAGPVFRGLFSDATPKKTSDDGARSSKKSPLYGHHQGPRRGETGGFRRGRLLPVDSEHSAIFQALQGIPPSSYPPPKLLLCASGGPFLGRTAKELRNVKLQDALKHPKWKMGAKITVDSATLMNKGLEVIEAHEAFGVPYDGIQVLVHPQAIVHSAVEMQDGAVIAQLGVPDMKLPIAYAFTWPHRLATTWPRLDLFSSGPLTFHPPDMETFACLGFAFAAGRRGGLHPAALNAANEEAVAQFLQKRIHFMEIPAVVKHVLRQADAHLPTKPPNSITLEDVEAADAWARRTANTFAPDPSLPR